MKKIVKYILLLLAPLVIFGCVNFFTLSDLRLDDYSYPKNPEKARQLFEEMGRAHQISNWEGMDTYRVTYQDEFYGFLGKQSHPFAEQEMTFTLDYNPNSFDGRLKIVSGKEQGAVWGMQDWQTYQMLDGKYIAKKNKDMKFWIPTYQYFIEFPRRIQEASTIDYIGTKTINGTKVEGVIASWNTVSPQKNIDQYIVWIDADTKRIFKAEYTVRDAYRFVSGAAFFTEYKDYDGIILPSVLPVESNLLKEGLLHTMRIDDFVPNVVEADALRPF